MGQHNVVKPRKCLTCQEAVPTTALGIALHASACVPARPPLPSAASEAREEVHKAEAPSVGG